MPFPTILFGFILATLLGSIFHLWRDGGFGKLILYLVFSWIGFFIGHRVAETLDINFLDVGLLHVGAGVIGSVIALFIIHWLSLVEIQKSEK